MNYSPTSASGEPNPMTEQQAITCLKQGDIAGLALLVQNYQVKAVHTALFIVHDKDQAEEIVQEAFLQVYRKIDQFDDRRPFSPWFLRIVINRALKTAKRQQRFDPIDEPEDGNDIAEWLIDNRPGPEDIAQAAEMSAALWKALERLTPNQRKAVVLRYFLEKDESEMIRELNQPLTTIKWWLYTARQRLKKLLSPFGLIEPETQEANHE